MLWSVASCFKIQYLKRNLEISLNCVRVYQDAVIQCCYLKTTKFRLKLCQCPNARIYKLYQSTYFLLSFCRYWLCNPAKNAAFLFRNNAMCHKTTHHFGRKALSCSANMITNENVEFLGLIILSWLGRKCMALKLFLKHKNSSLIGKQYLDRINIIHNVLIQRNTHTHTHTHIYTYSDTSANEDNSFRDHIR